MSPDDSNNSTFTQLDMFNPRFDSTIRHTSIDEEMYFSVIDVFEYYGSGSVNPRVEWERAQKRLKEQGFDVVTKVLQHQFDGQGQRNTPVATFNTFLRIAQIVTFKEWENIRQYMADAAQQKIEAGAKRKRDKNISMYERAGLGDHPVTEHLKARNDSITQLNQLKTAISKVCDDPKWASIHNQEYVALFGEVAGNLKKILNTKEIREGLPTPQLRALTYAESLLQQVILRRERLSNDQLLNIITDVIAPIGIHLKAVSDMLGIHPITGKPLLNSGKSLS